MGMVHRDLAVTLRPPNRPPKVRVMDGNPGHEAVLKAFEWMAYLWFEDALGKNSNECLGELRKKG